MPPVIAAVGTALGTAIGQAIIGAVVSAAIGALFAPSKPKQGTTANAQGSRRTGAVVNGFSTIEPIPVVYGELRMAPLISHMSTRGSDNKYLDIVVVWSEGEIEGIQNMYFDDKPLSDFGNKITVTHKTGADNQTLIGGMDTSVSGWASSSEGKGIAYSWIVLEWDEDLFPTGRPLIEGDIKGKLVYDPRADATAYSNNPVLCIRDYLVTARYGWGFDSASIDDSGTITSEANFCDAIVPLPSGAVQRSAEMVTNGSFATDTDWTKGTGWTVDTGNGEADKAAGTASDLEQDITVVEGTIYEVTFTLQNYSAGSVNISVGGTDGTSRNANGTYTESVTAGSSDTDIRFEADASFAGSITAISVKGVTELRYTCNGVVDTDQEPATNLRELESSCRAKTFFAGGLYKIVIDRAGSSSFVVDDSKLTGGTTIVPPSRTSKFNRVEGIFFNEETKYKPDVFVTEQSSVRASEDADQVLLHEMDLPFTVSPYTAHRITEQEYRQSRISTIFECTVTIEGFLVELMDIVSVTYDTAFWTNKLFRVIGMTQKNNDDIGLTLIEYGATVYQDPNSTTFQAPPGTTLPDLRTVAAPTGLVLTSGDSELSAKNDGTIISNIKAAWAASTDAFATHYEIEFKKTSEDDTAWRQVADVSHRATLKSTLIPNVDDAVNYDVRVRTINTARVASAWTTVTNHTVVGKTAAPSNADSFLVNVQPDGTREYTWSHANPPVDLDGYHIRYKSGTGHVWADMDPLHTGVLKASPFESNLLPAGEYTFALKSVDTTGNEATSEIVIQQTIADPRIPNALQTVDMHSLGFPGTKTDLHLDEASCHLILNSDTTWADLTTWADWTSWNDGDPATPGYYEHDEIYLGANVSFIPLTTATAQNANTTVEYQWKKGKKFRYFRLFVTDLNSGSAVNVNELELVQDGVVYPTSDMTGNSTPSPLVASASSEAGSGDAYRAFDGNLTTSGWTATGATSEWVKLDLGSGNSISVDELRLTPNLASEAPLNFRLEGSNTGAFSGEEETIYTGSSLSSGWTDDTARTFDLGADYEYQGSWQAAPTAPIEASHLLIRITVAAVSATEVNPRLLQAYFIASADTQRDVINDLDTSSISSPAGTFNVPLTKSFTLITMVNVTLQSVGGGWSFEITNRQVSGPTVKIYNASNVLADATVDVEVIGVP